MLAIGPQKPYGIWRSGLGERQRADASVSPNGFVSLQQPIEVSPQRDEGFAPYGMLYRLPHILSNSKPNIS